MVDTETVTTSGDGTYTTCNAVVATQVGTYTWHVSYAGDASTMAPDDQGGTAEQVTTIKASPTLDYDGLVLGGLHDGGGQRNCGGFGGAVGRLLREVARSRSR